MCVNCGTIGDADVCSPECGDALDRELALLKTPELLEVEYEPEEDEPFWHFDAKLCERTGFCVCC